VKVGTNSTLFSFHACPEPECIGFDNLVDQASQARVLLEDCSKSQYECFIGERRSTTQCIYQHIPSKGSKEGLIPLEKLLETFYSGK
jgi:hypothetical protein